ncbi:malate synthase A [Microlunatus antarcticus]|uniref:Malate synthase n=1 Tax=Microlunatus antarcticus TaxID=53388 RepID=A0A7W5JYK1_9ACTN|nr:malate synthase A [Microlunatus antarcticus]MBB3328511.1 malate synthase [Microlunatus antarcticus]
MTSSETGTDPAPALQVHGELLPRFEEILTPEALGFVATLAERFGSRRDELLQARVDRYAAGRPGDHLAFREDTAAVRDDPAWRVAPPAPGLEDRRAEMTGPTTRKMVVNALNSGARAWMADFEDATAPTWFNVVDGQLNLYDAIRGQVDFTDERGKRYEVGAETPTIMVRPRGWHLDEAHLTLRQAQGTERAVPGSLVDFGLYLFHNAAALIAKGAGPYFYLPKLESHLEARLWNDVFTAAQELLGIPYGTIRATCLIETTPAAFEMEEILYELRDHSSGLNAGRWDYIFSMIKNFAEDADHVLPDRSQVTMTSPFMAAYADLLVKTCHARGAHAIGGMAAFVPSRSNPDATTAALAKTTADKSREAGLGFDGSWVAHPALVQTCLDAFVAVLGDRPNQLERQRPGVSVTRKDLVDVSTTGGEVTVDGLRTNVRISLEYLSAWVGGAGAVAIDNLMEDAATVEISRMQVWHWLHHRVRTADGTVVTEELVRRILAEVVDTLAADADEPARGRLDAAREVFEQTCLVEEWPQFFTGYAYGHFLVEQSLIEQGLAEQGRA